MSELKRLSLAVQLLSGSCGRLANDRTGVTSALSSAATAIDATPEAASAQAALVDAVRLWQTMSADALASSQEAARFAAGLAG
ncbi:hypothetical protein [Pseudoclavibacter helvolus]|uniref:Uncharacterized protein n=1 Tax=Pseudoclavibacter helvolus TaxID=255205 RepID=A0A7W4UPN9_9MICO|nr:hypothetical protein [Pseudoclavibacter helvolus]MBB2958238.1 hypothetical protein [Pseudoclavibacter helvolus]